MTNFIDKHLGRIVYLSSAVVAPMLLALVLSPTFGSTPAEYTVQTIEGQSCLVDSANGSFAPSVDGVLPCVPASPDVQRAPA